MRRVTTTWRRLQSGEWKQSITLTTPFPTAVTQLLAEHTAKKTSYPGSKKVLQQPQNHVSNVTT